MKKEIRLNAFAMNCVAHQSPGLWTHPRDRTTEYNRLPYWIDLARTLERGRFDGLFLADVLGVYDVFGGSPDAALRNATQTPANDPLLLIPAMATVTKNLGFGVTSNLSYEPPYTFARRMSTLDHLTEGRIGWNVVTGYLDSAARGAGKDKQTAHDDRYDIADEYMEVVYKLWEGSWEDDAALRDPVSGIFAIPPKSTVSGTRETTIGSTLFI
jgi:alkanesulfonate monooxygenase SsuD/methylene tetrahydromethanopterin reductase-like flavin-dependent oxidoreductase (luciferase family)